MGEIRKLLNSQYFFCLLFKLFVEFSHKILSGKYKWLVICQKTKKKIAKLIGNVFGFFLYIETAQHTIVYFVIENTKQTM